MRFHRLSLLVAAIVLLAACGTEPGGSTTTAGVGQDVTSPTTAAPQAGGTTMAAADGVHVAETDLGSILVDPEGFTLYVFTNDSEGESTCYESCADLWPPLPADTAISSSLDGSIFGSVARDDGSEQLTVNGMPLYRYTPDTSPGDTNGQGFNGVWFVVDTGGNMIEAAAGGTATDVSDDATDRYDYDY